MAFELKFNVEDVLTKNPTLGEVLFVEEFLKESDEDFDRVGLAKALCGKVGDYKLNIILEYLVSVGYILFAPDGVIVYIWNPKITRMVRGRKRFK